MPADGMAFGEKCRVHSETGWREIKICQELLLLHNHALVNCFNWLKGQGGNQEIICCSEYAQLKNGSTHILKLYPGRNAHLSKHLFSSVYYSDRITADRTEELCVKDKATLQHSCLFRCPQ